MSENRQVRHCFNFDSARPNIDEVLDDLFLTPHQQILKFTIIKFGELCKATVIAGKDVLKKVTRDWRVLLRSNGVIENNLNEMRDFILRAEETETSDEIVEMLKPCILFSEFQGIVKKYKTTEVLNPTREIVIIEKALKENGIQRVNENFSENILKFNDVLENKFNIYINGLNEKEREEEQNFIKWFESVKKEDDTNRKVERFGKLFEEVFLLK